MLPEDQQRFLIATVVSIPLSLGLRYLPSLLVRKLYSLLLTTALQFYVYEHETWLVLALHVVMYGLIKVRGRQCGAIVTGVGLLFMSAYHIYRMATNYGGWQLDASTIIMLAVVKYSLFAYAYQDGATPADKHKFEHRKHDGLVVLPNFMDFLGYCQFLPTAALNTPFEYVRYNDYMTRSAQFESIPLKGSLIKVAKDFGIAVVCLAIYAIQMIWIPISSMKVQGFMESGAANVAWYSFWSIWLVKFKYYFGWKLSMLPLHVAGATYNPSDNVKTDQWLGIQTCNPYEIESTIHLREKIANWNMAVQEWLRKCIYERLSLSRSTAQLVTFAISAFWHGFYEGYYLTFGFWFLQMYVSGIIFKWSQDKSRPLMQLYLKAEPYSFWAIWLVWNWLFAHNGMYFHLLEYSYCFEMLAYFKYCSPILMIVLVLVFKGKGKGKGKGEKGGKAQDKDKDKELNQSSKTETPKVKKEA